MFDNKET